MSTEEKPVVERDARNLQVRIHPGAGIVPATHVVVAQVGDEIVSHFVSADAITPQCFGVAILMTRSTVASVVKELTRLVENTEQLAGQPAAADDCFTLPQGLETPKLAAARATNVLALAVGMYDIVHLAFAYPNPVVVHGSTPGGELALQATAEASISNGLFVGWVKRLQEFSSDG